MPYASIAIHLDAAEALVLFEMLSRWANDGAPLRVDDPGEKVALNGLLCLLEKQLVDPFRSDYSERLAHALSILRRRGGAA
jgi:hypothetical protein